MLGVIDDCAAAGVGLAIVGASGFAEAGPEGAALQDELVARARAGGVRLIGPNCIGAVSFANGAYATFTPLFQRTPPPAAGPVGLVSQSGAVGFGLVSLAIDRGVPLGWAITTGNEAAMTAASVLAGLSSLPGCSALIGYVDGLGDPDALRRVAASGVPTALLVGGVSDAGASAAASHTGALASGQRLVDGVLRQLGIAQAADVDGLLDLGAGLASGRRPRGPRVAIVSTSGGAGILAADELERSGLELASFSPETLAQLESIVPSFGSSVNPVDVTAAVMRDPALFDRCLAAVVSDPGVDIVVACFCVLAGREAELIADALVRAAGTTDKPLVVSRTGSPSLSPPADAALRAAGIPCVPSPSRAVRCAAGHARRARALSAGDVPMRSAPAPRRGSSEADLKGLLAAAGLGVPRGRIAASGPDAVVAVAEVGGRAAMKAIVPGLLHKTEAGGVVLGVTADEAPAEFARLAALGGMVLVEELCPLDLEVIVGIAPSPLGPTMTVGCGGILAEILADVAVRLLPVTRADVESMIDETRLGVMLGAVRGRPPLARGALVDLVLRLSDLASSWAQDVELDLNPVAVTSDRAVILDAAITWT